MQAIEYMKDTGISADYYSYAKVHLFAYEPPQITIKLNKSGAKLILIKERKVCKNKDKQRELSWGGCLNPNMNKVHYTKV